VPFCPTCRLEYRHGFSRCPDCDCDLVAALEDIPDPSIEDPAENYAQDGVPIAQFATQSYAELIKGGLKSLDIPVTLLSGAGHFGQTGQMGQARNQQGAPFSFWFPQSTWKTPWPKAKPCWESSGWHVAWCLKTKSLYQFSYNHLWDQIRIGSVNLLKHRNPQSPWSQSGPMPLKKVDFQIGEIRYFTQWPASYTSGPNGSFIPQMRRLASRQFS
jgi:hypothetical protein